VIVVGSVNVDLVLQVPTLPRPGETVIGGTFQRAFGGKGANAAAAAARLGAETYLVGRTGRDEHGEACRADLEARGVRLDHLALSDEPTGVAGILVDDAGENLIAVASGANADVPASEVDAALEALGGPGCVVVVNLELGDDAVGAAAGAARRLSCTLVVNAAPVRPLPAPVLPAGPLLVLNEHEIAALAGGAGELLAAGAQAVVVTEGARGCTLREPGWQPVHVAAIEVDVVDTTGAGDAFTAGFAVALAEGRPADEALRLGSVAGGLSCRALGARGALATREEADAALARLSPGP
jgi:ribokinase